MFVKYRKKYREDASSRKGCEPRTSEIKQEACFCLFRVEIMSSKYPPFSHQRMSTYILSETSGTEIKKMVRNWSEAVAE